MQKHEEAIKPSGWDRRYLWAAGLPVLLTALFYLPSLYYPFVNWDDPKTIANNLHIRSLDFNSIKWLFSNFCLGFWAPLTLLSQAVDYRLGGLNPFQYHLTNLALHAINTLLVFFLARKLLPLVWKDPDQGGEPAFTTISGAFLAALMFGLHPIHVEPVVWVTGRKDLLCGFFYLLSLLAYLGYAASPTSKSWRLYLTLLLFLFALMSKPMAITLPLVLLILDGWPLGRLSRECSKAILEKIPFFVVALIFGYLAIKAESSVEAMPDLEIYPWDLRMMNAFHSLVFYLVKIVWPQNLAALYPMTGIKTYSISTIGSAVAVIIISAACFIYRRKFPYLAAAWFLYLVFLSPVLGIFQVGGHAAADRYMYLTALCPFLVVSAAVARFLSDKRLVLASLAFALAVTLAVGTIQQAKTWGNSVTLWENVIRINPGESSIAFTNLGDAYHNAGRLEEALAAFNRAIAINPSHVNSQNGRATVFFKQGRLEEATAGFMTAIRIDPKYAIAHYNLGFALGQMGRTAEAMKEVQEALRLDPHYAQAYNNLGVLYGSQGRFEEAVEAFQKAAFFDPGNPVYGKNLEAIRQGAAKKGKPVTEHPSTGNQSKPLTMANPASMNCVKLGGKVEIRKDAAGNETGYCRFPDGRLCEEWALFREGKCESPKEK
jgi:protein O-mannosyl-transferase